MPPGKRPPGAPPLLRCHPAAAARSLAILGADPDSGGPETIAGRRPPVTPSRMHLLHLEDELPEAAGPWEPPPGLGRHLRALRPRPGELFTLVPPQGRPRRARWQPGSGLVLEEGEVDAGPALRPVALASAWPKGTRAEELVDRATEAGVTELHIIRWERSVAGPPRPGRRERLLRVARARAGQCRRLDLPRLHLEARPLAAVLADLRAASWEPVLLHPGGEPLPLLLPRLGKPAFLAGPEGGFTPEEEERLRALGLPFASLGPLILRVEAAGPLAAALVQAGT